MKAIIRSARIYLWPLIIGNGTAMMWVLGGRLTHGFWFALVIALLASFGFILNDLWDRRVDMANGGRRLANCGKAEVFVGLMACTILLSAGMVAAYLLGPKELRLAAVVAGGLGLYTILLRRFLLLPTVLAAFLATAPLWAPLFLIPANATSKIWSFCVTLVIIVAAREVFLDVLDRTGDAAGGRNTFATLFGLRIAKLVGVILTLGAVIPFSVVVGTSLFGLPFARQVLAILVAAAVLSLAVIPVLQTLDPETDRAAIQNYVRSSRLGIALLPALILILWLH